MASKVAVEDALLNVVLSGLNWGDIRPPPHEEALERVRGLIVNSGLSG